MRLSDCEHAGASTEAVREEQYVGVASGRDREKDEVFGADSDARPFRQEH